MNTDTSHYIALEPHPPAGQVYVMPVSQHDREAQEAALFNPSSQESDEAAAVETAKEEEKKWPS